MEHCSTTRIECFEETHSWTIENWKDWLKVHPTKSNKDQKEYNVLCSEKFHVQFAHPTGSIQNTTWQLIAFPEKDRHGRNSLKLKLVSHNGNRCVPPGTYDIKSEPLVSFHSLVWFGFHWYARPLDNLKAQFPVPYRWPKKNLKIDVSIKLYVPINLKSELPDVLKTKPMLENYNSALVSDTGSSPKITHKKCKKTTENTQNTVPSSKQEIDAKNDKTLYKKTIFNDKRIDRNNDDVFEDKTKSNDSLSLSHFPTAPSLMEPF